MPCDSVFLLPPSRRARPSVVWPAGGLELVCPPHLHDGVCHTVGTVSLDKVDISVQLANLIILHMIIMIIAIISFLSQLGINVTAALAGVGVVGIAIGFAAKETLANILSGFSIFIDT